MVLVSIYRRSNKNFLTLYGECAREKKSTKSPTPIGNALVDLPSCARLDAGSVLRNWGVPLEGLALLRLRVDNKDNEMWRSSEGLKAQRMEREVELRAY